MRLFSTWAAAEGIFGPPTWSEATLLQVVAQAECRALATPFGTLLGRLAQLCPHNVLVSNEIATLEHRASLTWEPRHGCVGHLCASDVEIDIDLEATATVLSTGVGHRPILPKSVRLYNASGMFLLSIAPSSASGIVDFNAFVQAHATGAALPPSATKHHAAVDRSPASVDIDGAMQTWHQTRAHRSLDAILEGHGVSRQQFYNTVPGTMASPVSAEEVLALLRWMVSKKAPMLMQVGRAGAATIARVCPTSVTHAQGGIHVAGAQTLLRLDPARLNHAWVVSLDTPKGRMRRVELLDGSGDLAVCLGPAALGRAASVSSWSAAPRPHSG